MTLRRGASLHEQASALRRQRQQCKQPRGQWALHPRLRIYRPRRERRRWGIRWRGRRRRSSPRDVSRSDAMVGWLGVQGGGLRLNGGNRREVDLRWRCNPLAQGSEATGVPERRDEARVPPRWMASLPPRRQCPMVPHRMHARPIHPDQGPSGSSVRTLLIVPALMLGPFNYSTNITTLSHRPRWLFFIMSTTSAQSTLATEWHQRLVQKEQMLMDKAKEATEELRAFEACMEAHGLRISKEVHRQGQEGDGGEGQEGGANGRNEGNGDRRPDTSRRRTASTKETMTTTIKTPPPHSITPSSIAAVAP
ncbi:hypothetical protein BDZ90DRAFT_121854 [Jaminaea rosea]|uniref:Uncharacterized protein n=1 Tax=Jaminaea rosea TaxID=1569628 RepID=A0A316UYL1_9BASI|nr:hypothetical protein BDZ90DRAFT_121854 [Jaminaea rosea]PWN29878.1 hypothetical protein BDZ90DRAFT_121854 [Jaminaea rosea]